MLAGPGVPEKRREVVGLVVCFLSLGVIFCIGKIYAGSLVGGWTIPIEKYISQIGNLPQIGVNIKKQLKPPPRSAFIRYIWPAEQIAQAGTNHGFHILPMGFITVAKLSGKKHASRLVGNGRKMGGKKSHFSHHDVGIQVSNSHKV